MTVDEILIGHEYLDRRGRRWQKLIEPTGWVNMSEHRFLTRNQMRLLIERDQHRDVCPGLHDCGDHPVHHAVFYRWERAFRVYEPDPNSVETIRCETLPEAMDAALAWAVGG